MDVLARETNRSPRPAERSDRRNWADDLLEVDGTSTSDTVEGQSSNLELYPGRDWQYNLLYHDTDLEGLLVLASVYLHYWLLIKHTVRYTVFTVNSVITDLDLQAVYR